jgi:hypothetical protein
VNRRPRILHRFIDAQPSEALRSSHLDLGSGHTHCVNRVAVGARPALNSWSVRRSSTGPTLASSFAMTRDFRRPVRADSRFPPTEGCRSNRDATNGALRNGWEQSTMTLLQVHFLAVSFWFGLLAAETVLELSPRAAPRTVAAVHKWIDLVFEGPVVLLVIVTGTLLLARHWPAPPLLLVKAAFGLVPVLANLYCFSLVLDRARTTDEQRALALTRRIRLTGAGIPFAIAAFVIGIAYLRPN